MFWFESLEIIVKLRMCNKPIEDCGRTASLSNVNQNTLIEHIFKMLASKECLLIWKQAMNQFVVQELYINEDNELFKTWLKQEIM